MLKQKTRKPKWFNSTPGFIFQVQYGKDMPLFHVMVIGNCKACAFGESIEKDGLFGITIFASSRGKILDIKNLDEQDKDFWKHSKPVSFGKVDKLATIASY
jgi:hypothetical protein